MPGAYVVRYLEGHQAFIGRVRGIYLRRSSSRVIAGSQHCVPLRFGVDAYTHRHTRLYDEIVRYCWTWVEYLFAVFCRVHLLCIQAGASPGRGRFLLMS